MQRIVYYSTLLIIKIKSTKRFTGADLQTYSQAVHNIFFARAKTVVFLLHV